MTEVQLQDIISTVEFYAYLTLAAITVEQDVAVWAPWVCLFAAFWSRLRFRVFRARVIERQKNEN